MRLLFSSHFFCFDRKSGSPFSNFLASPMSFNLCLDSIQSFNSKTCLSSDPAFSGGYGGNKGAVAVRFELGLGTCSSAVGLDAAFQCHGIKMSKSQVVSPAVSPVETGYAALPQVTGSASNSNLECT